MLLEELGDMGHGDGEGFEGPPAGPAPTDEQRPRIEGGADGRERLERDMGLEIDRDTGRAFPDQGSFHNLGLGVGGRFRNQRAVPRAVKCGGCGITVIEKEWAQGFQDCGSFSFDPVGEFFLCPGCVAIVFKTFPRVRAMVAAVTRGRTIRR